MQSTSDIHYTMQIICLRLIIICIHLICTNSNFNFTKTTSKHYLCLQPNNICEISFGHLREPVFITGLPMANPVEVCV